MLEFKIQPQKNGQVFSLISPLFQVQSVDVAAFNKI